MGLWSFLRRLFFGDRKKTGSGRGAARRKRRRSARNLRPLKHPLVRSTWSNSNSVLAKSIPYTFARQALGGREYLDLSTDGDDQRLAQFGLPVVRTPEELAKWLGIPLGRLAWLVHRFRECSRPANEHDAHYHYHWIRKRSKTGWRLIEAPKSKLKAVQTKILREILDHVPPHITAHGFTAGKSIVTNAKPHVGSRVILKFDLENFYPSVTMSRVTGIFRGLGYSREAAIWLARLTTSALPVNTPFIKEEPTAILPYLRRHLPQGAPTSPALANLSGWGLDVRLSGLAREFGARYTRYADDLTFSGPEPFVSSLRDFIPLATRVIRAERFRVNKLKRKVIRDNARQMVTGVVVNRRLNVPRSDYDRLKAILTNCVRLGPSTQNRDQHADFTAHLRGRIAHVMQLNPARGTKLLTLFGQIDWRR